MAAQNFILAAVLLTLVSGNPEVLQRNRSPSYGSSSLGSASTDAVRSGFISAADALAFGYSSSSSSSGSSFSSGSSSPSGSISLSESSDSGGLTGTPERSALFSTAQSGVALSSSQSVNSDLSLDGIPDFSGLGDVTITQETTVDVFKTVTNVIYNSIPITLTEFLKTTAVLPTLQVLSTLVDDHVFVATAPVTRTDSVTVTNTNTGYFYVTEVSTDTYTITHKAYGIRQKTLTSTLQQTQIFRPTVVRTRINTEYDTQTVEYLVTNTIVIQPRSALPFGGQGLQVFASQQGSGQGLVSQQGSGQGLVSQQGSGQGFVSQQGSGQGLAPDNKVNVRQGFIE